MNVHDLLTTSRPGRVAVLGIGNELNGDDAVGVHVVRRLARRLRGRTDVLCVEGATAPENLTGPLRRFRPDLVALVDAASFDQPPGSVAIIPWPDTDGFSASTHTLPPSVLAEYLVADLGCRIVVVGIQPAWLDFGRPLSPAVRAASTRLVCDLTRWLRS